MNPFVRSCFAVSFLLILSSPAFARTRSHHKAEPGLRITVRVYNYAHVPNGTLARAEKKTSEVFRGIGVETVWLDGPLPSTEADQTPACKEPFGPTNLVLRILPRSMTAQLWSDRPRVDFALGFAQLPSGGEESGVIANLFYHRVLELDQQARHRAAKPVIILGHAMAHEMGHLLLNTANHSPEGIMHVPWDLAHLERAARGRLVFTPQQAERLRSQVRARMRAIEEVTRIP